MKVGNSHSIYDLPLISLARSRRARSLRASSYDRSGANEDWITVSPGETAILLEHEGTGCVTHLYCAWMFPDLRDYRNAILRCYWDGATAPSVEVPLGEFFGIIDGRVQEFTSPLVSVNGGCGVSHGLNAYFPMPFTSSALITIENRGVTPLGGPWEALWYHIEYETYPYPLPADIARFHTSFRLTEIDVGPTPGAHGPSQASVVLQTEGQGHLAGLLTGSCADKQIAPGTESVFVDGEPLWTICGSSPPFGQPPRAESPCSRFFVRTPVPFKHSLRWQVEPHASAAYASVAYWYQWPTSVLPTLAPAEALLPTIEPGYDEAREALFDFVLRGSADGMDVETAAERFRRACDAGAHVYSGSFDRARTILSSPPKPAR